MKRFSKLLLALLILGVGILAAQDEPLPNDPNVNPDANACLTGGSMEGKCGDSEYLWAGAWYKIRYEYGLISRDIFPDQYKWMLPSLEEEQAATCTIVITSVVQSGLGLSSSSVQVPLTVIRGESDPNAAHGATPYGLDWENILGNIYLVLYGPSTVAGDALWNSVGGWSPTDIVSNTCPTPTPP